MIAMLTKHALSMQQELKFAQTKHALVVMLTVPSRTIVLLVLVLSARKVNALQDSLVTL
jgi:hypothetical protein